MLNEHVLFRQTLDDLTQDALLLLINYTEDYPYPAFFTAKRQRLQELGLVRDVSEVIRDPARNHLTLYGERFVVWYRSPHDTADQLTLF